ncbi:hypothetical protein [Sanguibacter suaedae]|uniref:Uncharacterized protein n=1 Tax=Sanguibacter suaedae TaxID=2795737 RepID=A0A934I9Y5_9MICO|nr:hypothetical protein [Sanguibacter suaedae]MBI9115787.1 hypothetical protein [Sanguibacter suaedae]
MKWHEQSKDVWTASTEHRVYTVKKYDGRWKFTWDTVPPSLTEREQGQEWLTLADAQQEAEQHSSPS